MEYRRLDIASIPEYLRRVDCLQSLLDCRSLDIQEVGDGNVNYVYKVTSPKSNARVILKQAIPYLRLGGEDWRLSRDRIIYEIRALKIYNEMLPRHAPQVYHADEGMSVVVMQCLSEHIILRYGMIEGRIYPRLTDHISTFLAHTLFKTSSFFLQSHEKRALMAQFNSNTDLCKLSEDLIFSFPFMKSDSNYVSPQLEERIRRLQANVEFKINISQLKYRFMTRADALVHGDLHTGSIMVSESDTYVIDPEFAVFGPFGFDIGKIVGNFLLSYISHYHHSRDSHYQKWLVDGVFEILNGFFEKFDALWNDHHDSALFPPGYMTAAEKYQYQQRFKVWLLRETVGFAGCVIARRILGIAGVVDIRGIEDPAVRSRLEEIALDLAETLVIEHRKLTSVSDLGLLIQGFFESASALAPGG